jgi:uncharacterized membrane protein
MGIKPKIRTKIPTVQEPEELILSPIKSLLNDEEIPSGIKEKIKKTFLGLNSYKYNPAMPSPNILKKYNDSVKNGAERILGMMGKQIAMAEKQSEHRMKLETLIISNQIKQSKFVQAFGIIIAILVLGSAVWLGLEGHNSVASILGGLDILGLVAVFIYSQSQQKPNLLNRGPDIQNDENRKNDWTTSS